MTTTLQKLGLTPAKGALIALLAVAMGWVWSPLLIGESKEPRRKPIARAARSPEPTRKPVKRQPAATVKKAPAALSDAIVKLSLDDATRHDPFAAPGWAPQAQQAGQAGPAASPSALRQRFESLASSGVAMVLVSEQGQAAQIGDRTVRVGDVIEGFRVVEITAQGVKFTPAEQGEGHGA